MRECYYDDQTFFAEYNAMRRCKEGPDRSGEWPTLIKMFPDLTDKRVLDLGCGYGRYSMYAAARGALQVLGIDASRRMIEKATEGRIFENVEYKQMRIEDYTYPASSFDVVLSSLTLQYVENLNPVFYNVYQTLDWHGTFVFTIEHPVFTACEIQKEFYEQKSNHWAVDDYFIEGKRETEASGKRVVKYHHTLTSILQGLLQVGFSIKEVIEPQPTLNMIDKIPEMRDELRRPMVLAISAVKGTSYNEQI